MDELFSAGAGIEVTVSDLLRWGETEQAMVRLREGETLDAEEAGQCLRLALRCPNAVFRTVLAACPPGEYADYMSMAWEASSPEPASAPSNPWRGPNRPAYEILGTIPVLAEALGETEKLRMLLTRGMDCSAASIDACEAVIRRKRGFGGIGFSTTFFEEEIIRRLALSGGSAEAVLRIPQKNFPAAIEGEETIIAAVTPLAAAVFFGQPDCVRLLLDQPGIRVRGSSALDAAALLASHGTPAQRTCVRLVYGFPERRKSPAEALCHQALVSARTIACFGTEEDLRCRLHSPGATVDEARSLLACDALWSDGGGDGALTARRLRSIVEVFPSLCKEPSALSRLLRAGLKSLSHAGGPVAAPSADDSGAALLRLWRESAGAERDISAGLSVMAKCMSAQKLRDVLDFLGEGGQLVAAAEAVLGPWPELELYALLRRVRFYRCSAVGVSALADRILCTQSLRLLRFAVKCGALAGEDRAALLTEAQRFSLPAPARASILMLPPRQAETRSAPFGAQWQYYSGAGEAERQEMKDAVEAAFSAPVPAETCRALLERRRQDGSMRPCLIDYSAALPKGLLRPQSLYAAALCAANPALGTLPRELFEPAAESIVDDPYASLRGAVRASITDLTDGSLDCSPLCLAAAAGNTAAVEQYLAEGADPDEEDRTNRSSLCFRDGAGRHHMLLVTPLAMARWCEQEETALQLIRAGADWPLAERIIRRIIADDDPEKLAQLEAEEFNLEWEESQ